MRSEGEHQPLAQRRQHLTLAEVHVERMLDLVAQRVLLREAAPIVGVPMIPLALHPALAHSTKHETTQRVGARDVDQLPSPATARSRKDC